MKHTGQRSESPNELGCWRVNRKIMWVNNGGLGSMLLRNAYVKLKIDNTLAFEKNHCQRFMFYTHLYKFRAHAQEFGCQSILYFTTHEKSLKTFLMLPIFTKLSILLEMVDVPQFLDEKGINKQQITGNKAKQTKTKTLCTYWRWWWRHFGFSGNSQWNVRMCSLLISIWQRFCCFTWVFGNENNHRWLRITASSYSLWLFITSFTKQLSTRIDRTQTAALAVLLRRRWFSWLRYVWQVNVIVVVFFSFDELSKSVCIVWKRNIDNIYLFRVNLAHNNNE